MAKIIRNGSVRVTHFSLHGQSNSGSLFLCEIGHSCLDLKYAKLAGEKKVLIKLSANEDGSDPTVISTGEDWRAYQYDDGLSVLIAKKMQQVNVVFYNKRDLKIALIDRRSNG
jgi:hypothetical protein